MRETYDSLNILSSYHREFESSVDIQVAEPLNKLSEDACSNINKRRRGLQKSFLDLRSAQEQLQKATNTELLNSKSGLNESDNSSSQSSNKNLSETTNKMRNIYNERNNEFTSQRVG